MKTKYDLDTVVYIPFKIDGIDIRPTARKEPYIEYHLRGQECARNLTLNLCDAELDMFITASDDERTI